METRTVYYETRKQMQEDVERLSEEGWMLQRLSKRHGETITAEFVSRGADRSDASPYLEGSEHDPQSY